MKYEEYARTGYYPDMENEEKQPMFFMYFKYGQNTSEKVNGHNQGDLSI